VSAKAVLIIRKCTGIPMDVQKGSRGFIKPLERKCNASHLTKAKYLMLYVKKIAVCL
jgi:hypothetical protein